MHLLTSKNETASLPFQLAMAAVLEREFNWSLGQLQCEYRAH